MAGVLTLARALAAGGVVVWDPPDRPRLRVPPEHADPLRQEAEEIRDLLRRAVVFRAQLAAAHGRPVIPYFLLAGTPEPRLGACISCGAPSARWRCLPCLVAVYVALGAAKALIGALAGQESAAP